MEQIKEDLTCFMLKLNFIDDPDILLGYPIIQCKAEKGKNKYELYPIPELLTYDGFLAQIGKQDIKLDYYFDIKFKSANNQLYNYWIPIYINENHYKKNKDAILNSFSIIKYGASGKKKHDFKPEHIFEVLPILLNKMIIGIFNGKTTISSSFIKCYFHYILLFKKLCLEFKNEYCKYVNHILTLVKKNNYDPNRKIIPDIGNFFMLLLFSNIDIHSEKLKKMWDALFEEFSIRRAYWLFYSDKSKSKMKKLILKFEKIEKPPIDEVCLKRFEEDDSYDIIKKEEFKEDIYWDNIYEQFYEIMLQDKNIQDIHCSEHDDLFYEYGYEEEEDLKKIYKEKDEKERRNFIKNSMDNDFKYLYLFCTEETRNKLNKIILKQLKFSKYCDTTQDEIYKKYEDEIEIKNKFYDNYRINEVLKDKRIKNMDEILKFAFDSQIGNKLLIITFFTKKKLKKKNL